MPFKNLVYTILLLSVVACKEDRKQVVGTADTTAVNDSLIATTPIPDAPVPTALPHTVEEIQSAYTATMQQFSTGKLDSTSFTYACRDEIDGTVTYYSDGSNLRMIVHQYSEQDHHEAEDRYFVMDDKLFFAYTNTTYWSFDGGGEGSTKDDITEYHLYLVNDKPIKCLEKKYSIRSKATDNPKPDDIANKDVSCSSAPSVLKSYQTLLKHKGKGTKGCLD